MEIEVIQGFLGLLQKISKIPACPCVSRCLGSVKPKLSGSNVQKRLEGISL